MLRFPIGHGLLALLALVLLIAPAADAATIRVPAHQPTIQAGIDAAADGDTVLVSDGTWTGLGNRDLDFHGKAITVRSQNGPEACIIDCEELGRGFFLHSGESRTSAIRGFTITRGAVESGTAYQWEDGGGIRCEGTSPVIEGNRIVENTGTGIACHNYGAALIVNNTIAGNQPNIGAGIMCNNASPRISNNRIHSNEVHNIGPGLGGGIYCYDSAAVIRGNEIFDNLAAGYTVEFPGRGGGICAIVFDGSIQDNIIRGNVAEGMGGGIFLVDSSPRVRNNLIIHNVADDHGGGIGIEWKSEPELIGNTVYENGTSDLYSSGGGLHITTSVTDPAAIPGDPQVYTVTVENCIFTGNVSAGGDQICLSGYTGGSDVPKLQIHYSDVEGGEGNILVLQDAVLDWGEGMIDADPLFVSGPDGDYYLSQIAAGQAVDSHCVDAGDPISLTTWGTTRTDRVFDPDPVDMGYHHPMPQRLVTGPGPGYDNPPEVRLFFPRTIAPPNVSFNAYGALRYGVNVTCGDVTGDGYDSIVTGAGPGPIYGPHVRGFDGTGVQLPGLNFLAYGTHKWGVNVACGDADGDGYDEIITGAGPGAVFGPHVRIWDYDNSGTVTPWGNGSWFSYGTLRWGVNVAAGDLDGDGFDEIITGAGPGAIFGPHVRGWDTDGGPVTPMPAVSFMAYGTFRHGVNVTCGDVDADGIDEIVTGPGPGPMFGSHVRGFNVDGGSVTPISWINLFAWPADWFGYGAKVYAGADLDGDGRDELVVGTGPDPWAPGFVQVLNFGGGGHFWCHLDAYDGLKWGTNVAGGTFSD